MYKKHPMPTKKELLKQIKKDWNLSEMTVTYKRVTVDKKVIKNAAEAVVAFSALWDKDLIQLQEQIWALFLSSHNRVIGYRMLGIGNSHTCILDTRMIVSIALLSMSSAVILAHN